MHLFRLGIVGIAVFASAGLAKVFHEQLPVLPPAWMFDAIAHPDEPLTLQIALPLRNLDTLASVVLAVSTPGSGCYGHHLTREQADTLVRPSELASRRVIEWLVREGIKQSSIKEEVGGWVTFETNVGQANRLLNADFGVYRHADGSRKIRTRGYAVPDELQTHVDFIHPTIFLGSPGRSKVAAPADDMDDAAVMSCLEGVSAQCVRNLYGINYVPPAGSKSRIGFSSFLNQSARTADLIAFQVLNKLPMKPFDKVFVNSAQDDQSTQSPNQGEANLDVQMMFGVAQTLPVTEFMTGGKPPFVPSLDIPDPVNNTNEPYLPYYQFLISKSNEELPQVISNSYGEPEQSVPLRYATRACWMAAILGARGISVIESTGDVGVGAACLSNDGQARPEFVGQFPSTCPFITGVGGTESLGPEIAWRDSSGGFSSYWSASEAPYQEEALRRYFSKEINQDSLAYQFQFFPRQGRGFPDVSAHSALPYYIIQKGGERTRSGGASAAAPVFGAIIGLLNDLRLRSSQPPLGFLNPWLYAQAGSMLTDITNGGSVGCTGRNPQSGVKYVGSGVIPWASWNATAGWDPVTGLGVPNFPKMRLASEKLKKGGNCPNISI